MASFQISRLVTYWISLYVRGFSKGLKRKSIGTNWWKIKHVLFRCPLLSKDLGKSVIFHYYITCRCVGQLLMHKNTSYARNVFTRQKYIFWLFERITWECLWQQSLQVVHRYIIIIIDVRFNNLLLFNLVFRLPLGDENEPVNGT